MTAIEPDKPDEDSWEPVDTLLLAVLAFLLVCLVILIILCIIDRIIGLCREKINKNRFKKTKKRDNKITVLKNTRAKTKFNRGNSSHCNCEEDEFYDSETELLKSLESTLSSDDDN